MDGQAILALGIRRTGVALAALLVSLGVGAQDLSSVAQRFLQRHGVPCLSVLKVGSDQELGEVAVCEDGREWALYWLEDEIAFIQPQNGEAYRWDREIYRAYPQLFSLPAMSRPNVIAL